MYKNEEQLPDPVKKLNNDFYKKRPCAHINKPLSPKDIEDLVYIAYEDLIKNNQSQNNLVFYDDSETKSNKISSFSDSKNLQNNS